LLVDAPVTRQVTQEIAWIQHVCRYEIKQIVRRENYNF
jgi:hypothetical protein